jgi:hypothetical protein
MSQDSAARTTPLSSPLWFRRHLAAYLVVNIGLTAANIAGGAPWWAFWPFAIWSMVLMVHYLVYKTATVDDAWVDERVEDLRSKSYDLSHIDDIARKPGGAAPERKLGEPADSP